MAKKKYDLITDLYAEAMKQVTASPENWMSFPAVSACRNFRLPFDEQILDLCAASGGVGAEKKI